MRGDDMPKGKKADKKMKPHLVYEHILSSFCHSPRCLDNPFRLCYDITENELAFRDGEFL